jgi:hypothetical protein
MINNCLVCGKELHRSNNQGGGQLRRSINSVTCSRQCSRRYTVIVRYIYGKMKVKIK